MLLSRIFQKCDNFICDNFVCNNYGSFLQVYIELIMGNLGFVYFNFIVII